VTLRAPPSLVRAIGGPAFALLARTWRIRTRHELRWRALVEAHQPFVFLLWHEALLPLLWRHRHQQIAIVVSEAREGRYLSDFAGRIGYRLLPGSSTRGGARALLGAIRVLQEGTPVAFTPDGPRGPRRVLKPGAIRAAQRAGALVLPLHASARRVRRLGSWDHLMIPLPFSAVEVAYGEPFQIGKGPGGLQAGLERAGLALAALDRELAA
jgi:lysophospholipid acyltransferase (LPLAT)-like uncharacterized protein